MSDSFQDRLRLDMNFEPFVDPKTGEKGKASLPGPMAPHEGAHFTMCTLQAMPPGLATSPLGAKDGVCGTFSFRDKASGKVTLVGVDGKTWEKVLGPYQQPPTALVTLPGDPRPRAAAAPEAETSTAIARLRLGPRSVETASP